MTRAVTRSREWWQHRSPAFLAACARLIEERIGRGKARAVVICGSFATGDESIVLETEPPILLSDVDTVVVVPSLADLQRWGARRVELGAACEALLPEVRFAGRVDVGFMLERDLGALPARPGVLDMRSAGRVLAGEPRVIEAVPDYRPSDIQAREAVILIENRIVSLLGWVSGGAGSGEEGWYRFRYEMAKAYTDMAAAALSIAGSYRAGYAARAGEVADVPPEGRSVVGRLIDAPLGRRIAAWTDFKIAPSRGSAPPGSEGADAALWEETASDLEGFWRRTAAFAFSGAQGLIREPRDEDLVEAGRRAAGARDRWRSWRGYLPRLGAARAAMILAGRGAGLLGAFPDDLIREHGARLLVHRVSRGAAAPVKRPAGGWPYRSTEWPEAAEELSRVWRELVFGRKEA